MQKQLQNIINEVVQLNLRKYIEVTAVVAVAGSWFNFINLKCTHRETLINIGHKQIEHFI